MTLRAHMARLTLLLGLPVSTAAANPWATEQAPAWGWKEEEVELYRHPKKPKPEPGKAWGAAVVTAPPAPESAAKPASAPKAAPPPPEPLAAPVKAYCQNIESAALDARFLKEKAELVRLQEELAKRTSLLEAKKTEYQEWLKRRDDFINKTGGSLVELYSKIKPDAAAAQLASIDEEAAAAILLKLSPRSASAILDQMDSAKAGHLVSVMIGAAKRPEPAPAAAAAPAPAPAAPPPSASAAPPAPGPAAQEATAAQPADQQPAEKKL